MKVRAPRVRSDLLLEPRDDVADRGTVASELLEERLGLGVAELAAEDTGQGIALFRGIRGGSGGQRRCVAADDRRPARAGGAGIRYIHDGVGGTRDLAGPGPCRGAKLRRPSLERREPGDDLLKRHGLRSALRFRARRRRRRLECVGEDPPTRAGGTGEEDEGELRDAGDGHLVYFID
jgi:hypothetical protein